MLIPWRADVCADRWPYGVKSDTAVSDWTAAVGDICGYQTNRAAANGADHASRVSQRSSALLAGSAIAGLVSQSACSNDASSQPAAQCPGSQRQRYGRFGFSTDEHGFSAALLARGSDLVTAGLANAAPVTQWNDRTDNSYDVQFQETVADIKGVWAHTPPTLVVNAVNSLPAVSFAASQGQTMIWTPGGSLDQGLTGFSAVFVIRPDTSVIYDASYLFITHTAEQDTRVGIVFNPTQGGVRAIINTAGTNTICRRRQAPRALPSVR